MIRETLSCEVEVICFKSVTVPSVRSRTSVRFLSTSSAPAPGWEGITVIIGGSISGKRSIVGGVRDTSPKRTMAKDTIVVVTGLSTANFGKFMENLFLNG